MVEKETVKKSLEPELLERIMASEVKEMKKKKPLKKHDWTKFIGIIDSDEPSDAVEEHDLID